MGKDRRFMDPAWNENPFFRWIKESFLQYQNDILSGIDCLLLSKKQKQIIHFWTKFVLDAYSPSNFPFTNPTILQSIIRENGDNLQRGFKNFFHDIAQDYACPPLTDLQAFKLGQNIATTPGRVVFENAVFQLIQYCPTHRQTYASPLLIIPAWINKYYLFDLSPENSFVRFNLEQGRTVFIMSWVNPDVQSCLTLRDYLDSGIAKAIWQVYQINGQACQNLGLCYKPFVNVAAMCAGGTCLLTKIIESFHHKESLPIQSATLLMTPFDFRFLTWVDLFIPLKTFHQHYQNLKANHSYIPFLSKTLGKIFCCLRANDLIWPNFVTRYWLGQNLAPLDFLYWNSDALQLPFPMLFDYIEWFFVQNIFSSLNQTKIDLPTFVVASQKDHLVPYASCFEIGQKFSDMTFVLSASGHIAGCINPPQKNKYYFYENDDSYSSLSDWLYAASKVSGSWWPKWDQWQHKFDETVITAFQPTGQEKAPGRYALSA